MHDFTICRADFYDLDIRFGVCPVTLHYEAQKSFFAILSDINGF